jgi:hypothetical protein
MTVKQFDLPIQPGVFSTLPAGGTNPDSLSVSAHVLYFDDGTNQVALGAGATGDGYGRTITDADATLAANEGVVYMASSAAHTFTWATNATVPLPLNEPVEIISTGTGVVTVEAPTGVIFYGPGVTGSAGSYAVDVPVGKALSFVQRATDEWRVIGGATVAPFIRCTLGTGPPVAQTIPASTLPFVKIGMDTVVKAVGGFTSSSLSSPFITIPKTGTYLVIASVRTEDGQSVRNVCLGAGTTFTGGVNDYWDDSVVSRYTINRTWFLPFSAGDQVALYTYSDGASLNLWNASISMQWVGP